jgi:hypothetical protein
MKHLENREVERLVRSLRRSTDERTHAGILAGLLDVLRQRKIQHTAASQPLWRTLMASPYSRFGAVAAIAIAAFAFVFLGKSATTAYAITDVSGAFDRAHVIHIKGRLCFPGHKMADGSEIPPVEMDNWIDVANHRYRFTRCGISDNGRGNVTISVFQIVCDGTYSMTLNSAAKMAMYARVSDLSGELMTHRLSQMLWSQLYGSPDQLADFTKTDRQTIDGQAYDIWQLDTGQTAASRPPSVRFKLWLAADDGRLGRTQMWMRGQDDQWLLWNDFPTIEYDAEPPTDTFAAEPPQGFTAMNSKNTSPVMDLAATSASVGASGSVGTNDCSNPIGFTLPNGSVVMAWRSSDRNAGQSQETLFTNLKFGGPLPKLPIEFYGLKPAGSAGSVTYTGYHLAYTRKANQFTEWSLYVPDGAPPASVKSLGYDVLYRYNLDPQPNARISLNQDYGLPIKTRADFEKVIHAAVAELSDDGGVPADLDYQKIIELARQIQDHGKQSPTKMQ